MNPDYRPYHPKWHRTPIPIFWWVRKRAYLKFTARELTSLFVAYSAVLLMVHVRAAGGSEEAYERFISWLQSPLVVALHVVVFIALLCHTVTWLNLAPKAMVIRLGGRRLPDAAIVLGHYAAWLSVSGLLAWVLVGT
ncbi:MAG: fumarate reductase subunit C [Gemmatimonadetes bacterium]|nr:fumarate reductase subunit C [Gemmatimonadota bacterium]